MQILIGCAKDMAVNPALSTPPLTTPLFQAQALRNAEQMASYTPDELRHMLSVSPVLAREVHQRYQSFLHSASQPHAAIALYNGVVFKNMSLGDFSPADFEYAQRHLWITSFLYGLLRPLDGIKPYRLEGKIELPSNDATMFAFWRPLLTGPFIDSILSDDGILIDLASAEMRLLFDWKKVESSVTVIKPDFYVLKNGKLAMPSVNAKKCRGAMASWLIRSRVSSPSRLSDFTFGTLSYQGGSASPSHPIYY